jgi:tripartite-type tricarboxylate transporter receptor subunit TctC
MLIRFSLLLLASILTSATLSSEAAAQTYPDRNIKLVVGLPAGGATDLQARVLAEKLSSILGQRVIVENRPGANGAAASRGVAKAEADGYTLAFNGNDFPINLHGMKEPGYSLDDFTVIGGFSYSPMVLIVSTASSKATILKEFVSYAKANPGKLTYATFGPQSLANLAANRLKDLAGIDWREVPYRGAPQIVQDLLNGNVDAYFGLTTVASTLSGQPNIALFGIADSRRNPQLQNVPTFAEAGIPQMMDSATFGVWVPARTPKPIVEKLRAALSEVKKADDVRATLGKSGNSLYERSAEQYEAEIRASADQYGAEFKRLGIEPE